MRGRHPDDDVLADLAADVLPVEAARSVEAHVIECEHCSRLLSDAERIRGLLVAGDPGPMPAGVWTRIEAALAAEHPSRPVPASAPPASAPPASAPPASAVPAKPGAGRSWEDDGDPLDSPDHWREQALREASPGSGSVRLLVPARREARRGTRRPHWGLAVAGAAAAAVAAVVAVGALRSTPSGSSAGTAAFGESSGEASSAASPAAAGAAAVRARYERSGTRYTSAGLANQARRLTAASPRPGTASDSAAAAGNGPAARGSQPAVATPDPTATDLSNPATLAGCLAALKTAPDRLVAVDLATYQGREAAVLLLSAVGGGYEVFVVERTCSAADDHSLAYVTLKG